MCKYCKGHYVTKRVEYSTKKLRNEHGGAWFGDEKVLVAEKLSDTAYIEGNLIIVPSETEYDGRTIDTTQRIKIEYCPMCGKKL